MVKVRKKYSWVSVYDSELGRSVSWDEMHEDWYREHQARRHYANSNHPFLWVLQSNWLHQAGLSLWRGTEDKEVSTFERRKVALMLAGMSIECAVKSRMITLCKFPLSVSDHKRIFSGAHNLVAMAESANIRTNAFDRAILASLTMYIRWLGRYPTPRSADEMVRYWLGENEANDAMWKSYCSIREKIGKSVTHSLRKWRPVVDDA
jgi:hypothetical protein